MRLVIFLTILFNLGCSRLPDKPTVTFCSFFYQGPESTFICKQNIEKAIPFEIPMQDGDKFISVSPEDWRKITSYINTLKDLADKRCQ